MRCSSAASLAAIPDDKAAVLRDVWMGSSVRALVVTWNMHGKASRLHGPGFVCNDRAMPCHVLRLVQSAPSDLTPLLPRGRYHIYAVGSEECEASIAKSLMPFGTGAVRTKERWEKALAAHLGPRYDVHELMCYSWCEYAYAPS
jgi:hypothetical protein